ncbi:hypothetical protein AOLI_G00241560 [Acnodon oligacanthus]
MIPSPLLSYSGCAAAGKTLHHGGWSASRTGVGKHCFTLRTESTLSSLSGWLAAPHRWPAGGVQGLRARLRDLEVRMCGACTPTSFTTKQEAARDSHGGNRCQQLTAKHNKP